MYGPVFLKTPPPLRIVDSASASFSHYLANTTPVPDYQSVSNSWTFLEVNVGIICACLPIFKAPIVKYFPRLIANKTLSSRNRSQDPKRPSMPRFGSSTRSHLATLGRPELLRSASDEEIMLDTTGIKKTTKVVVSTREVDQTPHALSGDPWETKWH